MQFNSFFLYVNASTFYTSCYQWVSDCCLTQQFSAISWPEQANFQWDDDEVYFVLDQHNMLSWIFFIMLDHWLNSLHIDMSPTRTHYPDSEPTCLCSFSLMLHVKWRSNKYQFYSLWFDPIGSRTHDLPQSIRAH